MTRSDIECPLHCVRECWRAICGYNYVSPQDEQKCRADLDLVTDGPLIDVHDIMLPLYRSHFSNDVINRRTITTRRRH